MDFPTVSNPSSAVAGLMDAKLRWLYFALPLSVTPVWTLIMSFVLWSVFIAGIFIPPFTYIHALNHKKYNYNFIFIYAGKKKYDKSAKNFDKK
jgi:hypothetical protein